MPNDFADFLSGRELYGDDFGPDEIKAWFADEAEGYANLCVKDKEHYYYGYHELNRLHGFKFIADRKFECALGIGSAYGDEFAPIAHNIREITILEPSKAYGDATQILGTPCRYRSPDPSGDLPFEDAKFDLITSFGVMHHIPNVSHVLRECARCLKENGIMLLRDPITSLGDWRRPRTGLTKRERGIPLPIFDRMVNEAGFTVVRRSLCVFAPLQRLADRVGVVIYNDRFLTSLDGLLSRAFAWNVSYHRTRWIDKFAPAAVYWMLTKR